MAIIPCPECGNTVSDKAKSCPHCGFEINPVVEASVSTPMSTPYVAPVSATPQPKVKKELTPEQKKIRKRIFIFAPIGLVALFALYFFLSPVTLPFLCFHRKKPANCTDPIKCSRCGKTWGNANGHDWIAATCTESKTCKTCGATEGEPNGHDWKAATCTEPKTCKACGLTEGKSAGHDFAPATCESSKKCRKCGAKSGTPLGHKLNEYICERCGKTQIRYSDVKNVIDIKNLRYQKNSVGGIEWEMNFTNKSNKKTINYIYLTIEHFNAVGDLLKNDIGGSTTTTIYYTGPLGPGRSSGQRYWDPCFYNNSFSGTLHFTEIRIVYSDGSELILDDDVSSGAVVAWR